MIRLVDPSDPVQVDEYLSARIESDGDCWVWTGARMKSGYGVASRTGGSRLAHRFSYTYHRAEIPDGLMLDHLCMNKSCINPWHLEPVTNAVNLARWAATNTHCIRGHEINGTNTYYRKNRPGRECRPCGAEKKRERLALSQ